jgi:opacity protein-like surface antigen
VWAERLRLLVALSAAAALSIAMAADPAEAMGARYMHYEGCMAKRFGKDFYERLGIATAINRWGAAEPTLSSLALQPEKVLAADRTCRMESGLEKEPRPKG